MQQPGAKDVRLRSEGGGARNHTEGCRRRIEKAMEDAKDNKWEKANSKVNEWVAEKIEEDNKKREIEEEGERQTKRQKQDAPQQEENKPQQEGNMAEQEPENRKRKATEEVQHDERQASKAIAVEDEGSGDESVQDLNAASVNTRGMLLNLRKRDGTSVEGQTETK